LDYERLLWREYYCAEGGGFRLDFFLICQERFPVLVYFYLICGGVVLYQV
jgi:hypothetical protein